VVDKDNRPWFYVTINDMSELVEEKNKLRRENTELGAIINSIPVGLSVYRLEQGEIELIAANEMVGEILEIEPEQMSGKAQSAVFRARSAGRPRRPFRRHAGDPAGRQAHESAPFRYSVQERRLEMAADGSEDRGHARRSLLVYSVLTDLTAEKRAEEELERAHRTQQEQYRSSLQALLFANPQSLCTVRLNLSRNKCEEWYGTSQYVIHTIKADTAEGVIDNISASSSAKRTGRNSAGISGAPPCSTHTGTAREARRCNTAEPSRTVPSSGSRRS
jgi:PAS domain-containing protein